LRWNKARSLRRPLATRGTLLRRACRATRHRGSVP
jgi:hypothetical protein